MGRVGLCFILFLLLQPVYSQDSVTAVAGEHYRKGIIYRLVFGSHYRNIWQLPVKAEVFDFTINGQALTPVRKGGSWQTTSLVLTDNNKREYVLRLLVKSPERGLPPIIQRTFVSQFVKDQNTAENPYGALIVPHLSKSANLLYHEPLLVYIPSNDSLGKYSEFAGQLALLELKGKGKLNEFSNFGNADQLVSTSKMLKDYYKSSHASVDETLYLKSRLFDMLISDWGRHEDQWRWAKYKENAKVIYKPVARDRDHAFYKFHDGILPYVTKLVVFPKGQSFGKSYGNIEGLNRSAHFLDERLLKQLELSDWLTVCDELTTQLSDSAIHVAVASWPKEVYDKIGKRTEEILKYRRDHLRFVALEYYKQLSERVEIATTNEDEIFEVTDSEDGSAVTVYIFSKKKNGKGELIYSRKFYRSQTKVINLRPLAGNDEVILSVGEECPIKINIIKSEGTLDIQNKKGTHRNTRIIKNDNCLVGNSFNCKTRVVKNKNKLDYDVTGFKSQPKQEGK